MYNNNPYLMNMQRFQPQDNFNQPMPQHQYIQQIPQQNNNYLLGKSVDSIEVVKAMDIPLDGSTSYFPLADGSAIVTKKLQIDGTSKTIVYKPIEEDEKNAPKYITIEDLEKAMKKIDLSEIEDIKDELKIFKKDLKEVKSKMKIKED